MVFRSRDRDLNNNPQSWLTCLVSVISSGPFCFLEYVLRTLTASRGLDLVDSARLPWPLTCFSGTVAVALGWAWGASVLAGRCSSERWLFCASLLVHFVSDKRPRSTWKKRGTVNFRGWSLGLLCSIAKPSGPNLAWLSLPISRFATSKRCGSDAQRTYSRLTWTTTAGLSNFIF